MRLPGRTGTGTWRSGPPFSWVRYLAYEDWSPAICPSPVRVDWAASGPPDAASAGVYPYAPVIEAFPIWLVAICWALFIWAISAPCLLASAVSLDCCCPSHFTSPVSLPAGMSWVSCWIVCWIVVTASGLASAP